MTVFVYQRFGGKTLIHIKLHFAFSPAWRGRAIHFTEHPGSRQPATGLRNVPPVGLAAPYIVTPLNVYTGGPILFLRYRCRSPF